MRPRLALAIALAAAAVLSVTAPARADGIWKLPPVVAVTSVQATSTFADKRDSYAAWRALAYTVVEPDVDPMSTEEPEPPVLWSAWCEGKKGNRAAGEGLGETLTITLAEPTRVDRVRIAAGVWRTDKLYAANNRLTALTVLLDGAPRTLTLPGAATGKAWVEIPVEATIKTLAFRIDQVARGRMNDSCIAGIDLMRGGHRLVPMIGFDARAASSLQPAVEAMQRALEAPDQRGLQPLLDFPFSNHDVTLELGYGGGDPVVARRWRDVARACAAVRRRQADDASDPVRTACPMPVPYSADDDREPRLEASGGATVEITWPSSRPVYVTWTLFWNGRWQLADIGGAAY